MVAEATGADAETGAEKGTAAVAGPPLPPPQVDLRGRAERRAAPFGPEKRGRRDSLRVAQLQRAPLVRRTRRLGEMDRGATQRPQSGALLRPSSRSPATISCRWLFQRARPAGLVQHLLGVGSEGDKRWPPGEAQRGR